LCADGGGAGEEEKCLETRAARVEDEEDTLTGSREGERVEREEKREVVEKGGGGGEAEEIRERDEGTAVGRGRGTRCRNTAWAVGGRSNGAILSLSLSLSRFSFFSLLFSRLF
jgi:hypothetical protein